MYGNLDILKLSVSEDRVKISEGSLCKWYLGNNLYTMKRNDTEQAIQKLSDILHLPFQRAFVTRLDVGRNFILKFDKQEYLNHLGNSQYFNRLEQTDGLYYNNNGLNLFRYEMRLKKRLTREFNLPEVRAYMLYDTNSYMRIVDLWFNEYQK